MKTVFTFFLICIMGGNVFSQSIITAPTKLKEIRTLENSFKSIPKGFHYFSPFFDQDFEDIIGDWPAVKEKPFIYKRTNDSFYPTLHTWYFHDADSVVGYVVYNWGFANTTIEASNDEIRAQVNRFEKYKKKYDKEKKLLVKLLGQPTHDDLKKNYPGLAEIVSIWDLREKRIILRMTVDKKIIETKNPYNKEAIISPHSEVQIKVLLKDKNN